METDMEQILKVDDTLLVLLNSLERPDLLPLGDRAPMLEVFQNPAPGCVGKAGVVDTGDVIVQSTISLLELRILKIESIINNSKYLYF